MPESRKPTFCLKEDIVCLTPRGGTPRACPHLSVSSSDLRPAAQSTERRWCWWWWRSWAAGQSPSWQLIELLGRQSGLQLTGISLPLHQTRQTNHEDWWEKITRRTLLTCRSVARINRINHHNNDKEPLERSRSRWCSEIQSICLFKFWIISEV